MASSVWFRQSTHNDVRISDCLHLTHPRRDEQKLEHYPKLHSYNQLNVTLNETFDMEISPSMSQFITCIKYHTTYLVDVVTWYGVVEHTVKIIQQFDDLYWSTFRRQQCEPDNIREVDGCARKRLWRHSATSFQFVRHVTEKQHRTQGSELLTSRIRHVAGQRSR